MYIFRAAGLTVLGAWVMLAQDVISARSGLIHYTEGIVLVNGKQVERKAAEFPAMKDGEEIRTELGRAEILLSPGIFLRLAENSSVRLISGDLSATSLEVRAGSALLEVGDLDKSQSLTVKVGDKNIEFAKRGLFRLDADPARIAVYDGSALVRSGSDQVTVKDGRQAALTAVVVPVRFNKENDDAFHRWAERRSGYIAAANLVAAKRVSDGDSPWRVHNWMYNPYLGLFTYIPLNGMYRNPFGYSFYSPGAVQRVYYRPDPVTIRDPLFGAGPSMGGYSGGRGMSDMGGRGMGSYSGGAVSAAPPASSGPAAPAAGPRGGDGGGGSRSSGSGR